MVKTQQNTAKRKQERQVKPQQISADISSQGQAQNEVRLTAQEAWAGRSLPK